MEDVEIAYAAGIIDGEGTITLGREKATSPYRHLIVSVSSTTIDILRFLQTHYSGSISTHKTYAEHHLQSWSWKVQNRGALKLCSEVLPYLLEPEKKRRALLCVSRYLQVTPRNGRYTEQGREAKLAFEREFFHPSAA